MRDNSIVQEAVGRMSGLIATPLGLFATALLAADLWGTAGWATERVTATPLFTLFGVRFSWPGMAMTAMMFLLTTGIQLQSANMAFSTGSNPYLAGVGAVVKLVLSLWHRRPITARDATWGAYFIQQYELIEPEHGGMSWVLAAYWPSQFLDMWTDLRFYQGTSVAYFAVVFMATSLIAETVAFLAMNARVMAERYAKARKGIAGGVGERRRREDF